MAKRFRIVGYIGSQPFVVKTYAEDAYEAVTVARKAFLAEHPELLSQIDKILVKEREAPKAGKQIHVGKVRAARRSKEEMAAYRAQQEETARLAAANGEQPQEQKRGRRPKGMLDRMRGMVDQPE